MERVFRYCMIAIGTLAMGALVWALLLRGNRAPEGYGHPLVIGGATMRVAIADTDAARDRGLSGVRELPPEAGMYFVFDEPGQYGFWMKGMAFPIDIIWIAESGMIVGIEHDVHPDTYPQTFVLEDAVQYVLEVNAGFSTAHGIEIGDMVALSDPF